MITNEQEYEAALARIEVLMDAVEDSDEGRELVALAIDVENYEDATFPLQ